jgi:hypothetical protein
MHHIQCPSPNFPYQPFGLSDVNIGPIKWGHNIEGQFHALLSLMPSANHVSRNITARRTYNPAVITVRFPTAHDAAQFITHWRAYTPKGYESVTVALL